MCPEIGFGLFSGKRCEAFAEGSAVIALRVVINCGSLKGLIGEIGKSGRGRLRERVTKTSKPYLW